MVKVENEIEPDRKNQTTNINDDSNRKLTGKVSSDRHPAKLPTKSGVPASKTTVHNQTQSRRKPAAEPAVISSTTLKELNTDLASNAVTGRTIKKQIVHYKPAHHSAPFKTTLLPPGRSKLPAVSRPGSRQTTVPSVRQSAETRGIDRHGGKMGVACGSAASHIKEMRRIVDNGGRQSVTRLSAVSVNGASSSFGRNSPGNLPSECEIPIGQTVELQTLGSNGNKASSGVSDDGISNNDGISTDNDTGLGTANPGQTTKPDQSDDSRTLVAASAMVGQQILSASSTGITTNQVSRRAEAVNQSQTVKQQDANHSKRAEGSTSFTLQRDGQVMFFDVEFITFFS